MSIKKIVIIFFKNYEASQMFLGYKVLSGHAGRLHKAVANKTGVSNKSD